MYVCVRACLCELSLNVCVFFVLASAQETLSYLKYCSFCLESGGLYKSCNITLSYPCNSGSAESASDSQEVICQVNHVLVFFEEYRVYSSIICGGTHTIFLSISDNRCCWEVSV